VAGADLVQSGPGVGRQGDRCGRALSGPIGERARAGSGRVRDLCADDACGRDGSAGYNAPVTSHMVIARPTARMSPMVPLILLGA
jgi:hypothetical protein